MRTLAVGRAAPEGKSSAKPIVAATPPPRRQVRGPISKRLEITMLARRIAISVCTLCLAIPAAAGASPATNPSKAEGPYGIPSTGPPSTVLAKGPYGIPPTGPPSTVKPKGPYGKSPTTRPQSTTGASIQGSAASPRADTNGWRIAALSGAALLAAVLLAWALLLPARRRAPRMVT